MKRVTNLNAGKKKEHRNNTRIFLKEAFSKPEVCEVKGNQQNLPLTSDSPFFLVFSPRLEINALLFIPQGLEALIFSLYILRVSVKETIL